MRITITMLCGVAVMVIAVAVSKANGDDEEEFVLNKDEYYKVIASFWTMDFQTKNLTILCLGALIKSDWVVVTKDCNKILSPSHEILVSIGRNYLNNLTIDSTIKYTQDISLKSRLIIVVLNTTTEILTPLKLDYVDDCNKGEHDKVLVGWNILDGPVIKTAAVEGSNKFYIKNYDNNYSCNDFHLGSLIIMGTKIIGFTKDSPPEKILFYKVTLRDVVRIERLFQIASNSEDKNDVMFSPDEYFKVIASFWKVNFETKHRSILCLGALIRSNWILTNRECDYHLYPLKEIGVLTGSKYFIDRNPEFILDDRLYIGSQSNYVIIILNTNIELSSSIELGFANEHVKELTSAVWIGWNQAKGPTHEKITVEFGRRINLPYSQPSLNHFNFPIGSFIIRGKKIVAFTYFTSSTKFMFYKVVIPDYMKIEELRMKANKPMAKRKLEDDPPTKRHHSK